MEYDENGNLLGAFPAKISAVHIPEGKRLGIMDLMGGSHLHNDKRTAPAYFWTAGAVTFA